MSKPDPLPGAFPWQGLSGKVLALVVLFVMIGEVMIFLPSVASYRLNWLESRVKMAEIAALAVEAAARDELSPELRRELLDTAGVEVVALKRDGSRELILKLENPPTIETRYDLRETGWFSAILDALVTLARGGNRVVAITAAPPGLTGEEIELVLDERPLWRALMAYSARVFTLSIVLSLIVAALAFFALNQLLVRPIRRLSNAMVRFADRPDDLSRIVDPGSRNDEIGVAERELANMQRELSGMLAQKGRLAALGLAVTKVSHDLRNMLSTAQIISDRLADSSDPTVQRLAPKLISSLDRAIDFLMQTLRFGRVQEAAPRRERLQVKALADEVFENVGVDMPASIRLVNAVKPGVTVDADREQLFRVLVNLVRNAVQALADAPPGLDGRTPGEVRLTAWRDGASAVIEVVDDGPGVPARAREHLFEPFRASMRPGGTGLGLPIARELVRAHGGDIDLVDSPRGALFRVTIPDRATLAADVGGPRAERRSA
jgi:signal transduction histidine kinase